MQLKRSRVRIILSIGGIVFALIGILGGSAAYVYGFVKGGGEPERYLVSALVMCCGGVLWFLSSLIPTFHLSPREYFLLLTVLVFGLILGASYTFAFCGGECGCFWYHGYPGYWLRISKCVITLRSLSVWNVNAWNGDWNIDVPSLLADVMFWIDAGLIGVFVWKFTQSNSFLLGNKS